ncbi:hypothetical protein N7508_008762 [Penicillium antarcticum]|uniref:uncharacterized protein n=1 Tax=Penicillium antarcticum TaxID=416450 RepID=UPI00239DB4BD|nr:uncharacterized protein N7508_008762 [Penicillium antarcticum]KAJ5293941.1 hypothetical protein N7508_008762 [Penicillium antarcticum]
MPLFVVIKGLTINPTSSFCLSRKLIVSQLETALQRHNERRQRYVQEESSSSVYRPSGYSQLNRLFKEFGSYPTMSQRPHHGAWEEERNDFVTTLSLQNILKNHPSAVKQ